MIPPRIANTPVFKAQCCKSVHQMPAYQTQQVALPDCHPIQIKQRWIDRAKIEERADEYCESPNEIAGLAAHEGIPDGFVEECPLFLVLLTLRGAPNS